MRPGMIGQYNGVKYKTSRLCDALHAGVSDSSSVWVFACDNEMLPTGSHYRTMKEFENQVDNGNLQEEANSKA